MSLCPLIFAGLDFLVIRNSRHFVIRVPTLLQAPTTSGRSQLLASGGDRSSCLRKLAAAEGSADAEEARRSVASAHRQQQRALL